MSGGGEGLKQRKGGKKEEKQPLVDKEDKPKPPMVSGSRVFRGLPL